MHIESPVSRLVRSEVIGYAPEDVTLIQCYDGCLRLLLQVDAVGVGAVKRHYTFDAADIAEVVVSLHGMKLVDD